jgi:hypothetical protein
VISTENAEERTLAAGASRSDGANVGLVLDSDVLMRQQYRFESCQDACKMEAARARTHTHTCILSTDAAFSTDAACG